MKKFIAILTILLLAACTAAQPDVQTPAETAVPTSTTAQTATIKPTMTWVGENWFPGTSTPTIVGEKRPTATQTPISTLDGTWVDVAPENWVLFNPWEPEYTGDRGVLGVTSEGGFYVLRSDLCQDDDCFGVYQNGEVTIYDIKDSGLAQGPYRMVGSPDGAFLVLGYEELALFRHGEWQLFPTPSFPDEFMSYRLYIDPAGSYWIGFYFRDQPNELRRFEGTSWKETILVDFDLWTLEWSPDGTLWGRSGSRIMKYENWEWKKFFGDDLWEDYLTDLWHENIRMTVSDLGNVYVTHTYQDTIAKIDSAGNSTEIPLSESIYFDYWVNYIFILGDEEIWIYCSTKEEFGGKAILAYYVPDVDGGDGEWYLINESVSYMRNIIELPDGRYLIDTMGGQYIYTPEE